jgi:hypothetical protein
MPNLKFDQLLVMSDSLKAARQFKFSKTLNLITAKDNTVGKSTVVKLLFWVLGCEPTFDTTWKNCDCKCLLNFTIDNEEYWVFRYKDIIFIKNQIGEWLKFNKITGDFSEYFANLVQFKVLLPNRMDGTLEIPPPAYYFLPFYIDQKRSWAKAWDNFENLEQYANWKSKVIEFHVGLLKPVHFELEKAIQLENVNKKAREESNVKLDTTISVVEEYIPKNNTTLNENEFLNIAESIKIDLSELTNSQEELFEQIATLEADKAFLTQQAEISEKIIKEVEADYKFTIENIAADEIECPLCGVVHENSIVNRASILSDKDQAEKQLSILQNRLTSINSKLEKSKSTLEEIRAKIRILNDKYSKIDINGSKIQVEDVIDSFAAKAIEKRVGEDRNKNILEIEAISGRIKDNKKLQKELTTKEEKKSIGNTFMDFFSTYIHMLGAEGINLSEISKPTDYSKIQREGGAAEGTRGMLAYYLSVYSCITMRDIEAIAPLVVDTPNQHEQSDVNYEKIVRLLISKMGKQQIVLCAMENDNLEEFKKVAKVFELTNTKILQQDVYEELKPIFDWVPWE